MRVCCFLLVAVLLATVEVVSAVSNGGNARLSKLTSVDSVSAARGNSDGNRLLRTRGVVKEEQDESDYDSDDDTKDEERNIHELLRKVSFKQLDDVAKDLVNVPGAAKYIKGQNEELFRKIAKDWTPQTLSAKLGIAEKKARMTKIQLKSDPDYLFAREFTKFYNHM
ncbi:hypothetical protein PHYBOEH_006189 [Phytophthora boehmeriae]|uniref:RxLR effector protein n=1 Tax=Phytophthora boehmeriae TaxID=109152 RepID=A0A8T1WI33_9STRA|nr:hypothetical protein PHYBOEH_006189 [Phytophthora boehmeriae]